MAGRAEGADVVPPQLGEVLGGLRHRDGHVVDISGPHPGKRQALDSCLKANLGHDLGFSTGAIAPACDYHWGFGILPTYCISAILLGSYCISFAVIFGVLDVDNPGKTRRGIVLQGKKL